LDLPAGVAASSPTLIRAAAATALGDGVTAERLLRTVIQARPLSDDASEAHELLSRLYLRLGQYDRLFRNFAAWERNFPSSPAVREERTDIEFLRGLPDQRNGPRRASTLTHEAGGDFTVPVTVNGRTARYLLDTGAWASLITAGEAKRLGLRVRPGVGRIGDASGLGVSVRTAVVDDLRLGSMRFRQVSFVVVDNEEEAGILGIPVILATGRVHWSVGGTWELGGRSEPRTNAANLVFFENKLLLALTAFGRRAFGTLDTGAVSTDLNSNFEEQFREHIQGQGTVATGTIEGVGGTASFEMLTLPEVALAIDRTSVTLRPARVMRQRVAGVGGTCCIGNVGLDLLTQHREIVIDLSEMTLRIK
jgi:hypothetical protein